MSEPPFETPKQAWLHWCGELNVGRFSHEEDNYFCTGCRSDVRRPHAGEVQTFDLVKTGDGR